MIEQRRQGRIINIISTAGHQGEPGNIAYCTAKCGLLNFTRSAAMELVGTWYPRQQPDPDRDRSVENRRARRALGAAPCAPTATTHARVGALSMRVPMQKLPGPSDYGRAAAFLASDDAAMITGTDLRVDAGAIARYWAWDPSAK